MTNFDPQILTLMRETEHMIHLGFDIPPAAKARLSRQADITNLYQSVNVRISLCYILCTRPDNSDVQASELLEFNVYKNKLEQHSPRVCPRAVSK